MPRLFISNVAMAATIAVVLWSPGERALAKKDKQCKSPGASASTKADDPGCKSCLSTAASLFAQGKNDEAANILRQWSDKCPNSSQLHLMLSTILLRTGDKAGAEAEAGVAAATAPNLVATHLQYALTLMTNHRSAQAKRELERVTELDPGSYEAWSSLASLNKELHQDDESARCAEKAADLEPATKAMRLATLLNLKRAGKYTQAKAEIKRLLADSHASPEFSEDLAREAMTVGAFDEAIEACQRVSSSYPNSTTPLLMQSLAHYCTGNWSGSAEDATRLLVIEPRNADGAAIKAMALLKQNKLAEADALSKSAESSDSSSSSLVLLGKGAIALSQNSYEEAERALQNCLETDASNSSFQGLPHTLAHMMLSELYSKTGKSSQAAEQSRQADSDKRFSGSSAMK